MANLVKAKPQSPAIATIPRRTVDNSSQRAMLEFVALMIFTLLPVPIIWFGLNILENARASILLFHGLVLLPAIVWWSDVWMRGLRLPTKGQTRVLITFCIGFVALALTLYETLGEVFLSTPNVFGLLLHLGHKNSRFIPLGLYFIFINSTLEELFWRGIVLTKLDQYTPRLKYFGILWSSFAYGLYHYSILQMIVYPFWAVFGTFALMANGIVLAVLYRRTHSIVLASLYHALSTDLTAIALVVALFNKMHAPLF